MDQLSSANLSAFSSSDPKTAVMQQVRQEAAVANARALFEKLNEHCFERCVPTPGSSMSKKEEGCFTQCIGKYMDAWNAVSRQYVARLQQNQGQAGGMGSSF